MSEAVRLDLLDLLDRASDGRGEVRFLPDEPQAVSMAEIWRASERSARWLSQRYEPGETVAMVLGTGSASVIALFGAWRAGLCVASLPTPARGCSAADYQRQVEGICRSVGAVLLLVEDAFVPFLPPLVVPVAGFAGCQADGAGRLDGPGELVQFTSGSTAAPKGIRLGLGAVAANVCALIATLALRPGDGACSWLPLSHDMGLIGMLLTSWCATSPDVLGEGQLCLIRPEHFLRQPAVWLEACGRLCATVTAAPDFAFTMAQRTLGTINGLDLRRLRVCITGGETVRAETLEAFAEVTASAGFRSLALCPSYGMAEAALAVTMVPPDEEWSAIPVESAAVADGIWRPARGPDRRRVVSAGAPLPGMAVRVTATLPATGVIEVSGPSMLTEYVGQGSPLSDGWLATTDIGVVVDHQLYPVGRRGDRIVVAGRNLDAREIENRLTVDGVRRGAVAAVDDGVGGFAIVAETQNVANPDGVARAAREQLIRIAGFAPSMVVFVERGSLPKTPSGKLQRNRVTADFQTGGLLEVAVVRFRGAPR